MYNGNKIKYSLFPYKRKINQKYYFFRNLDERLVNKNKSVDNDKNKDILYLKQQLLNRTNSSNSSRNMNPSINPIITKIKFKSIAKSDIFNKFSKSFYNLGSIKKSDTFNLTKTGTMNKGINCDISKDTNYNTSKNFYSVYYINSVLDTKKNDISDLLINQREDKLSKTQRASDIQRKIKSLEKNLNLSSYTTRTNNFFKPKKNQNKINEKNKKNNSIAFGLTNRFSIKDNNKTSFLYFKKIRDKFMLEKLNGFFKSDDSFENENKKKIIIDNKLNIIYSENLNIFRQKLKDINNKIILKGKKEKLKPFYTPSERQLKGMDKKVTFMKNVLEYAFPISEIAKLTERAKKFRYNRTKGAFSQSQQGSKIFI